MADGGADAGGFEGAAEAVGQDLGGWLVALDGQDAELVAAEAGDHVGGPPGRVDHLGGAAQQPVAGGVALVVVDPLQLVQVDRDQGRDRAVAAAAGLLGLQQPVPGAAVADPGERVGEGVQLGQLEAPLQLLALQLLDQEDGQQPAKQLDGGQLGRQVRRPAGRVDPAQAAEHRPVGGEDGDAGQGADGHAAAREAPA